MADDAALLPVLLEQEVRLQFTQFTNETALAVGMALVQAAQAEHLAVTIDIVRHGHQLFHVALPGTTPDNDRWIQRKNRVVQHFGHSSYYVGMLTRSKGMTLAERSGLDETLYAAHGGAFPIIIANVGVVGTITVSGLPQADDHGLVVRVLEGLLHPQG